MNNTDAKGSAFSASPNTGKPSRQSRFTMGMLRMMKLKEATLRRVQAGKSFIDSSSVQAAPNAAFAKKYRVSVTQVDGCPVYAISPRKGSPGKTMLYLHGGAYSVSFASGQWKLFEFLIERCGCTVVAPDYPLPPAADWRQSWAMVEKVYNGLSGECAEILLMGDSAGGGFALAFAQMLAQGTKPQPERIILLSPWLDIGMTNPAIPAMMESDPLLSVEALRLSGMRWAGGTDPSDWHLSPVKGSLAGLPPIDVFTGTADVLNPDAKKLYELSAGIGKPVGFYEYPGMMHVWMLFDFPESLQARAQIAALLR